MQVATPPSSDIPGLRPIAPSYQSNLGRTVWTPTCSSNSNDVAPTAFIDVRQSSQPRTLPTFGSRMPGAAPPTTVPPDINCHETNASLGLAPSNFSELYGLTSDMEPILMRHRPYDAPNQEFRLETHSIRKVLQSDQGMEYPVTFHVVHDSKAIGYHLLQSEHDNIEACVAPHGPRLMDLFWRIMHPSFPILHRQGFVQKYSQSYQYVSAPLLGAMYLIALGWWDYDRELSNRSMPDATSLRKLTLQAIQNSYHRPKLDSIEAMLLLLQCKPEDPLNPDHTWDWGCTGQFICIGQALGLHLDASSWSIPDWEKRLRKRLSWAIYMQDKWTALAHGRPSHVTDDEWMVADLDISDFESYTSEDGEVRVDSLSGAVRVVQMVQLTRILSDVMRTFYTLRASKNQDTSYLYAQAMPLLGLLDAWHRNLPKPLQMNYEAISRLCPNGYLSLAFFTVKITILRRLIRSTALEPLCLDVDILTHTRTLAHETAQDAITFVSRLRPDHLEAFWYFASPFGFSLIGSFTTLLLVTSRSEPEKTLWRESLNRYLWTLRLMSKACGPMKYAVNRLEGAILKGMEHALSINLDELFTVAASPLDLTFANSFDPFENLASLDLSNFDWLSAQP
ncbi:hypothetical protein V496_02028 [Pseudogymnoascus sp. VKM F-4515 (FW-2607)]|nr:hypothetical protein V496_02028 [Pseudogymnoascus sp. VKM F-4515 (FW-2607)]KFY94995.1 hypothetical protein V498_03587 [Pseudogymnoascus sp. VKM F-4517 (FW-2822)]